jgi:hypothetical protein
VGEIDECDDRPYGFVFPIYYTPFKNLKIKTALTITIGKVDNFLQIPSPKAFHVIRDSFTIPSLLPHSNGESEKIAQPIDIHLNLSYAIETIIGHRLGPPVIYKVEQLMQIRDTVKVVRNFLNDAFSNEDLSSKILLYDRRMLNMLIRAYKNYRKIRKIDSDHIDFCIGIYYTMLKTVYPITEYADFSVSVPNEIKSASYPSEVSISEIGFLEPDIEFLILGKALKSSEKIFSQILGIACYLYMI